MATRSSLTRILGITLIGLALLIGFFSIVAYLGWRSGQEMRLEQLTAERTSEIERQLELAASDMDEGGYRLALRRLEWVLEQEPQNATALRLRDEATAALEGPDPTETEEPEPTVTPAPTREDPGESESPGEALLAAELETLRGLVADEEWEEAIRDLRRFQRDHPDFERRQTDELLFEAYTTYGEELLYTDQVELGLFYLRQAQQLGDLPAEIRDQREWARLYLGGISFYRADWASAILFFRELCLAAPFYQNACQLLEESLQTPADQYAAQLDWCPAIPLYEEAYRINQNTAIRDKLGAARSGCAQATPVITGTVPLTGTTPFSDTLPGGEPAPVGTDQP